VDIFALALFSQNHLFVKKPIDRQVSLGCQSCFHNYQVVYACSIEKASFSVESWFISSCSFSSFAQSSS
jgi:hypothetical protein